MNGKPVYYRKAKTVLNASPGFAEKGLCTGMTLSQGDACTASCTYCYVPSIMLKLNGQALRALSQKHEDVVIRRSDALELLRAQLIDRKGNSKYFMNPLEPEVVFCSPLVDCAGNPTLARETADAATLLFDHTPFHLRLLSKYNFLPQVVAKIPSKHHHRLILGVSTGTFDEKVRRAIEPGTASVEQRLKSLYWLQDRGFRTYGMVCPSLPQDDYRKFARVAAAAVRVERCEHYWAEVINLRGESFTRTLAAMSAAGLGKEMKALARVCGVGAKQSWEEYARATFLAHTAVIPPQKLKFLQYPTAATVEWWQSQVPRGAVLLGCHAKAPGAVIAEEVSVA